MAAQKRVSCGSAIVSTADAVDKLEHIELSIDFGTSSTKLAYRLRYQGASTAAKPIRLDGDSADLPGCLAYHEGSFYWGHDLIKRVQHDPEVDCFVPADQVVESVKILFYEQGEENGRIAARARKALGNVNPVQAVSDYLKQLILGTRTYLHEQNALLVGAESLLTMPVKVRLSVPQIWTLSARRRMAKAAHDAGIETVVLASEPQCVLANYLDLLQQSTEELPISLTVDDYILIVDLGCGTADFVLYRIKEDLQVSTRLETDEKFSGALCGSIRVNEQLLEKVMPGEAELQGVLDRLQVSKEGLEWHLLQSIEKAKTDRKYPLWHKITALGPDNGEDYGCKISRQDLEDAQDDSITRIKGIMDNLTGINNHRPNKPKLILVAGGYRKSPYLMGKLKKRYDKPEHRVVNCSDRKNPEETMVCDGGLSVRYSMVAEQSLPTRLGYALLRDDTVSKKRHPDCYLSGRGDRILRKTRFSGWDNKTKVTIDRLHIILPKGVTVGNQPIVDQFDHEFCCHPNQGFIEVHNRFVAFSGDYTEDNSALEDNHDAARSDNPLRHDIYEWAAISLTIPEQALIDRRFPKLRDDEGQEYYKFKANIILKYEGEDNITITWQIKTPSGQNFKEPWIVKGEESVWSARASEFTIEHDPGIEGDGVDSLEA